jgi:N-acetylmuramoyl-L-alanine amidase
VKKILASSVLSTAILFPGLVNAEDLTLPANMVVDQKVEVRKGATTSYPVVTSLASGQNVKVVAEFTNSIGELWYRVDLGSTLGWAPADHFISTSSSIKVGSYALVAGDNVNVRKGATTSYEVITKLSDGTTVKVIDQFKNSLDELWYRIEVGETKGWVVSTLLEPKPTINPPAPPTDTNLPAIGSYVYSYVNSLDVRRGASLSYASVATLSLNQKVQVVSQFTHTNGESWLRVAVNSSLMGWVPASSVGTTAALNQTLYVTVDNANLRNGPSLNDEVIDQVDKGTVLKAISSQQNSSTDLWYKVITPAGQTAWIHSSIVSKTAPAIGSTMYIGTRNAAMFSGASFQYRVTERLTYNSKVTVLREFVNSLGQTWVQIKSSTGKTGWTPAYEVISSKNDYDYLYALNKAVIRKGAATNYAVSAYLKENEPLIVLTKLGNWTNVETLGGTRGWIDNSQTSPVSLKRLTSPTVSEVGGVPLLTWTKPIDFNFTYSTTSNQLKLTGGLTDIALPTSKVPGIKSITTSAVSATEKSAILTFEPGYTFTIRNYNNKITIKVIPTGLAGKKIILDPGHGGHDPGAIGPTGLKEKDVNLGTALLLKKELEKYGATVKLTRSTDVFLELSERTAIANSSDYDAFISIHADSYSSTSYGSSTYYNSTENFNGPKSKVLAYDLLPNMTAATGTYNRGVKMQNLYVNRMNELSSVLVELAFISNPKEEGLLKTTTFRQKASEGIRKGLQEYFSGL